MSFEDVQIREHVPLLLAHTVLFPGMLLPARIQQPAHLEMMDRVLNTREELGVVLVNYRKSSKRERRPHMAGTLARVVRMERHPNGSMNVVLQGTQRFHVRAVEQLKPYPQVSVEFLQEGVQMSVRMDALAARVRELWFTYSEMMRSVAGVNLSEEELPRDAIGLAFFVATHIQSGPSDKQRLVSQPGVEEILAQEIPLLRKEIHLLHFIDGTQGRVEKQRLGPTGYISQN